MNPIYVYLNNSKGKKISVKKMSKDMKMRKKDVIYYCFKDPRIRRVNGIEVGSGKRNLTVFTIDP